MGPAQDPRSNTPTLITRPKGRKRREGGERARPDRLVSLNDKNMDTMGVYPGFSQISIDIDLTNTTRITTNINNKTGPTYTAHC